MGRPSKFNREAAVEVVMNEIWKKGFEACSVKAISEKLGITRSSFYNAFESREALFMEALELYASKTPNVLLRNIDENTNITATITKLFREICRFQTSDPEARGCMAVNSITELVAVNNELGPQLKEIVVRHIKTFTSMLDQAKKNGEISADANTKEIAIAIQNTLLGLSVLAKIVRSEQELWASIKTTLKGLGVYNDALISK
ncbi:MAG: TetR/AcrR family transcriptional regulator [Sphingomonadales bacterium]|nr:TetR/AcrR family transcriptional regulator [Sphingomonadales bacterium]